MIRGALNGQEVSHLGTRIHLNQVVHKERRRIIALRLEAAIRVDLTDDVLSGFFVLCLARLLREAGAGEREALRHDCSEVMTW